jgi:hypothetical protein
MQPLRRLLIEDGRLQTNVPLIGHMDGFVTPLDRLSEICWRLGYVADRDLAAHDLGEWMFRKEEDSLIVTIANHIFEAYAIGESEEIVILRMVLPIHPLVRKTFMNIEEDAAEAISFDFFTNAIHGSERTGFLPDPVAATTIDAADALIVRHKLLLPHADHVVMQRVMDAIQELLSRFKYLERELFRAFMAACTHLPEDDESNVEDDDEPGFDGFTDFKPGWQHRLS